MHIAQFRGLLAIMLGTIASLTQAARYNTTTIINSNCPCDRHLFKYCYKYTRQEVEEGQCYTISKASRSMRVYDPWMGTGGGGLACIVFGREGCSGRSSPIIDFDDNGRCVEPTVKTRTTGGGKDKVKGREDEYSGETLERLEGKAKEEPEPDKTAWWYRSFRCHVTGWQSEAT